MLLGLYVNFYAFSTFLGFIHTKQKLTISVTLRQSKNPPEFKKYLFRNV